MGKYKFLQDDGLENARALVEKAATRVGCAAKQLGKMDSLQVGETEENLPARLLDEEKGLELFEEYNNGALPAPLAIRTAPPRRRAAYRALCRSAASGAAASRAHQRDRHPGDPRQQGNAR